jgi:hypothetical protein
VLVFDKYESGKDEHLFLISINPSRLGTASSYCFKPQSRVLGIDGYQFLKVKYWFKLSTPAVLLSTILLFISIVLVFYPTLPCEYCACVLPNPAMCSISLGTMRNAQYAPVLDKFQS